MQPQIKGTIIKTTHILAHTCISCMHGLCLKLLLFNAIHKMQSLQYTVIDVVLWFYILLMIFTSQFHSYVCFCFLRGK